MVGQCNHPSTPSRFAMRIVLPTTALAVLLPAVTAYAQQCPEPTRGDFTRLDVAQVKPGRDRVAFTTADCASTKTGACQSKAFVVSGDLVLISQVFDASACAVFVNAKGQTTMGLLPNNRLLAPTPRVTTDASALVGTWKRTEATIAIKRKGGDGSLTFAGDATYGAFDKARIARGAVNMGEFSFSLKPASNSVDVSLRSTADGAAPVARDKGDPTDCAIAMIALGPYLVVEDNLNCGGANVSFTGIYRRLVSG